MRRPIAARDAGWAKNVARILARRGVSPNAVSGASVACAALAALCLVGAGRSENYALIAALFCGAALLVQLRLLCNLFDGMLAVEWNQKSALGPLWNDFPDRPADALILVGCGYAGGGSLSGPSWLPILGWLAAALAVMTAYTRVLGVAVGARETFAGPMAKQHRMAVVTLACVSCAPATLWDFAPRVMTIALAIIVIGCVLTMRRRLIFIANDLKTRAQLDENEDEQ